MADLLHAYVADLLRFDDGATHASMLRRQVPEQAALLGWILEGNSANLQARTGLDDQRRNERFSMFLFRNSSGVR